MAFDYLKSRQRIPGAALPAAFTGGAGSTTSLDGTGWHTLDAKGTWRPAGGVHVVTFGAHEDGFKLNNPKYALDDWIDGSAGQTLTFSRGRTETQALWVQDVWSLTPQLKATLWAPASTHWRAYDGLNLSVGPALDATRAQSPKKPAGLSAASPKADAELRAPSRTAGLQGLTGRRLPFPTVTGASSTSRRSPPGRCLSVPSRDLRPERARSPANGSAERFWSGGSLRVSLFDEAPPRRPTLSQSAPLLAGSTSLFSFVQNVDRTHATGIELVADQKDVTSFVPAWSSPATGHLRGGQDRPATPPSRAAEGQGPAAAAAPQGAAVATYAATPRLDVTLAARYSRRSRFATIDNSDPYANTYQGFGGYFVADAHVRYAMTLHLAAGSASATWAAGPASSSTLSRSATFVADLKYSY